MRRASSTFFLMDVAFHSNVRWRRLARRLPDPRDYQGAIGTFVVALAAARGNGLPDLDLAAETEDSPYLADLIAVGLLTPTGIPESPWKAYAPARPKYPGESTNATNATNATESTTATESTPRARAPLPSLPFPSTTTTLTEGANLAPAREDGRPDLEAFLAVRYRIPTPAQRTLMDAYCDVFDLTGPQRAADLIYRHPDDPIGALKADLAAFRAERISEAKAAEAKPRPAPRRAAAPTGIRAELAKLWAQQEAEKAG